MLRQWWKDRRFQGSRRKLELVRGKCIREAKGILERNPLWPKLVKSPDSKFLKRSK